MIDKKYSSNYCSEDLSLIENYAEADADTENLWFCHHKLGVEHSRKYLIENNLYYHRPAAELVFVTKTMHAKIHNSSERYHNIMKEAMNRDTTRRRLSAASKGKSKSAEHRLHIQRGALKRWSNPENRLKQSLTSKKSFENHPERREAIRRAKIGKHWYTDGKTCCFRRECPEGFWPGKTFTRHKEDGNGTDKS